MANTQVGTIIIGAGLAGLAAARELARNDHSFILLEARDRIGGRVLSHRSEHCRMPIELGAEWIEEKGEVAKILKAEGVKLKKADGEFLERTSGGLRNIDRIFQEATRLARKLDRKQEEDRSLSDALLDIKDADREQLGLLLYYVKSFHAADPDRLSVHWLREVEAEHSADAAEMHSSAPLEGLCYTFTKDIKPGQIHLSTVVEAVKWEKGSVLVKARRFGEEMNFSAQSAIITLPLSLLKITTGAGSVRFDPPLHQKAAPLSKLAMGNVIKLVLVFDRPFWLENDASEKALFIAARDQDIPTFWTTSPEKEPVLVAWTAGSLVDRLPIREGSVLLDRALSSAAVAFNMEKAAIAARLRSWHYHNWIDDPWSRGAYSYVMPGGIDAHVELARPIEDTLFFAGEATADEGANATMEGAIQSGLRAAKEVIEI